jgi:hypothetical protein
MAMTMVAMIVMEALLIVAPIFPKSDKDTLPLISTNIAPAVAGMASFKPFGRQRIMTIVNRNAIMVSGTIAVSSIIESLLFSLET